MDNIEKDLNNWLKEIETAKSAVSRIEGKIESEMRQLKETYNIDTLEEVEDLYNKMLEEIEEDNKQIEIKHQEIKSKLEADVS